MGAKLGAITATDSGFGRFTATWQSKICAPLHLIAALKRTAVNGVSEASA
jgi:hypothetical protein